MSKTLIFIPVYNCEKQISRVLQKLKDYDQYYDQAIVVNNMSTDNSKAVVLKTRKEFNLENKIKLIDNQDNYSLGGSQKIAFNYALNNHFDHLIVLHGDDQADLGELTPYLTKENLEKYDCILGARFHKDSTLEGYSWFRTFGNHVFIKLTSFIFGTKVDDLDSGLKLYSIKALKNSNFMSYPNDLTFHTLLLFENLHDKLKLKFIPMTWSEEDQVSNARVFKQAFYILKILTLSLFSSQILKKKKEDPINYRYEIL